MESSGSSDPHGGMHHDASWSVRSAAALLVGADIDPNCNAPESAGTSHCHCHSVSVGTTSVCDSLRLRHAHCEGVNVDELDHHHPIEVTQIQRPIVMSVGQILKTNSRLALSEPSESSDSSYAYDAASYQ